MKEGVFVTDGLKELLWQPRVTGSVQMASFMESHERRQVKETDRGEVPARQLVAMFTSHPHPPPGRGNTPHGALCTAVGTDVTHDAIFLPAG